MSTGRKEGGLLRGSWQLGNGLHFNGFDGAPVLIQLKGDPLSDRHIFEQFRFDDLEKYGLARCGFDEALISGQVQSFEHSCHSKALDLVGRVCFQTGT